MTRRSLAALGLAAILVGCVEDQSLNPPTASAGSMFTSYVAIGNSITAGFQSGGIDSTTQAASYAVLLAGQMGTEFHVPWLRVPGCPPPYTNIFTQTRVGGLGGSFCALRTSDVPPRLNLVAVPGAAVIDVLTNLDAASGPNTLTTFLLGGQTQFRAARDAQPTFVTVWIGNNDALGAVLNPTNPGDSTLVTSPATFASRYTAMLDSLEAIGTITGGALIGVVQVGAAPYLTQGRVWKGFEAGFDATTNPLNALDVNNCTSFFALGGADTAWAAVPFPVGGAALALAQARIDSVMGGTLAPGAMQPAVIDCNSTAAVSLPEMIKLTSSVAQYNAAIAAEATDRGWVFVDPNVLLGQLVADTTAIRRMPTFTQQTNPSPFGTALSHDGIHPSSSTHRLVTNALIAAINAKYSTNIPALP